MSFPKQVDPGTLAGEPLDNSGMEGAQAPGRRLNPRFYAARHH